MYLKKEPNDNQEEKKQSATPPKELQISPYLKAQRPLPYLQP